MSAQIDLDNAPIKRTLLQFFLPSVFAMTIKSIFILTDLAFVGQGVGVAGLGAISLTVPFFSFSMALAEMVGVGGATLMSIQFGKKNHQAGQSLFEQSLLLFFALSAVMIAVGLFWIDEIVALMGARGELHQAAADFLSVMMVFFMFQGGQFVLAGFIRNDTNPRLVMRAMVGGSIANIILDYTFIFIFDWGIKGAALATGLGQSLIFITLLTHFIQGKGRLRLRFTGGYSLSQMLEILKTGIPTFFLESVGAVTTLVFNYVLLAKYGALHVTAYSIIMNTSIVVLFIVAGLGQACQPIISYNFGAGRMDKVKETVFLGIRYAGLVGVIATVAVLLAATQIVSVFTQDHTVIELAAPAMKIYFLGFVLMGINIVIATLFQSIGRPKTASIISLSEVTP
ncbi:MATE family efflux transporter [Parendozoicomonas haliclonae]|uniref:Multidrug export protein MepA n=1 Tax=Parendozoicomonas haliclonae TaxID=1960125 RepID=A0A1X7AFZ0_9GAMM|nr:MATE family efflux transporter [Parendozoicomonas haliclonae]SMA36528.1 Multidrug export protein MepA [Parendozoicomonas haliclonae]